MPKPHNNQTVEGNLRRFKRRIEDLIDEGRIEKALQRADEALDATIIVRADGHRGQGAPIQYKEVPDHGTRMAAARFLIEAKYGRPKVSVDVNHNDARTREQARLEVLQTITGQREQLQQLEKTWQHAVKTPDDIETPEVPTIELVEEK